jgi:hypothetical protein
MLLDIRDVEKLVSLGFLVGFAGRFASALLLYAGCVSPERTIDSPSLGRGDWLSFIV